jgi:galactoside O-acetyltransferase
MIPIANVFTIFYSFMMSKKFVKCGIQFRCSRPLVVRGGENICIGNSFNSMGLLFLYAEEGRVTIGDNCSVNTNVQIGGSQGEIVIGNGVLIGPNVVIRAAEHSTAKEMLIRAQKHKSGVIEIEDDVWIGANCVITKNVTLAKGTVVGAGSVVTRSTEAYSIVCGVPAKIIAMRE